MTGQHDAPRTGATITVTTRDGRQVTTSTWSTCTGVAAFVTTFLGPPAATHALEEEPSC